LVEGRRTAIDIGAHKGIWTCVMMDTFEEVHSFEPVSNNYSVLKTKNPNSYQVALGNCNLDVLMSPGENTGMYHISDDGFPVQLAQLDDYTFNEVDFIKIDVEGYELHVIEGGRSTIKTHRPAILLEENGLCQRYGVSRETIWETMHDLDYKLKAEFQSDYLWLSTKT